MSSDTMAMTVSAISKFLMARLFLFIDNGNLLVIFSCSEKTELPEFSASNAA